MNCGIVQPFFDEVSLIYNNIKRLADICDNLFEEADV